MARQVLEDGPAFKADYAVFWNGLPRVGTDLDGSIWRTVEFLCLHFAPINIRKSRYQDNKLGSYAVKEARTCA